MKNGGTNLAWISERHLRVSFEGPDAGDRVALAYTALRAARLAAVSDLTPAYATILIHVDPRQAPDPVEQSVRAALRHTPTDTPTDDPAAAPREIEVPVCYGGPMGPDLAEVAHLHGLSEPQAIELHAGPVYTVRFLGFSPGFPYLSGLPPTLATPRLDTPRPSVPAGSIAIAGDQAGIYPRPTPGGWRILGRTPLSLFDPARTNPVLLRPGDRLRFRPITPDDFERLAREPRG